MRKTNTDPVNRIIDANFNRLKEGLRVCEEVTRFVLNDKKLTSALKDLRHKAGSLIKLMPQKLLLKERDAKGDIGMKVLAHELKRNGIADIFLANIQRAKESARVLEEFLKLKDARLALKFKTLRYGIYDIEKKAAKKITAVPGPR